MGLLRYFFTSKDEDRRVKYWIYATGPLNALLWGSNHGTSTRLQAFHHIAIKCILRIKWPQMHEQWITNEEVWSWFLKIPNINKYIIRQMNEYIGKTIRANNDSLNKKLIGTWIFCPSFATKPPMAKILPRIGPSLVRFCVHLVLSVLTVKLLVLEGARCKNK